jgi:hypothetical protein
MFLAMVTSVVPTRFDRRNVRERWGHTVEDFLYGACDPSYQAFLLARRATVNDGAPLSNRFKLAGLPQLSPIVESEEPGLLGLIERSFGWKPAEDVEFTVDVRPTGYTKFYTKKMNMDGIELDECGWLIGNDFAERQRQQAQP